LLRKWRGKWLRKRIKKTRKKIRKIKRKKDNGSWGKKSCDDR
jgi:myosin heavy subunit